MNKFNLIYTLTLDQARWDLKSLTFFGIQGIKLLFCWKHKLGKKSDVWGNIVDNLHIFIGSRKMKLEQGGTWKRAWLLCHLYLPLFLLAHDSIWHNIPWQNLQITLHTLFITRPLHYGQNLTQEGLGGSRKWSWNH